MTGQAPASAIESLVIRLARLVRDDDVAVVGIGTPVALAALLLARRLHAPAVTILMPGARNPVSDDLSGYIGDPVGATAGAAGRMSRLAILDAIASGEVTLQFIRPAQIDARLRLNTERVTTAAGTRYLVGPVALPEVTARVSRVIAYLPRHDRNALVPAVDAVTAPTMGGMLQCVVTPMATIRLEAGQAVIAERAAGVSAADIRRQAAFVLGSGDGTASPRPGFAELTALRTVIDPLGLIGLEDPDARPRSLATLRLLWPLAPENHRRPADG